jgi:hypothetical protein
MVKGVDSDTVKDVAVDTAKGADLDKVKGVVQGKEVHADDFSSDQNKYDKDKEKYDDKRNAMNLVNTRAEYREMNTGRAIGMSRYRDNSLKIKEHNRIESPHCC